MKSPLYQYDKAMYDRIHSLYDEVYYGSQDEIFKVNAKAHRGKVVLPFIGIWRVPDFSINPDYHNDSFLRRGWGLQSATNSPGIEYAGKRVNMHGLPVTLQYQIDIYATKRDVCDGLTAELVMEFKEKPWINVQLMDIGEHIQQFNLDLDDSISDNTDISGFDETNRFYRLTLTLEITSAVIYRAGKSFGQIDKFEFNYNYGKRDPEDTGDDSNHNGNKNHRGIEVIGGNKELDTDHTKWIKSNTHHVKHVQDGISPGIRDEEDLKREDVNYDIDSVETHSYQIHSKDENHNESGDNK